MSLLVLTIALCFLQLSAGTDVTPVLHPDTGLTVIDLITQYGYPLEQHWVTTSDGYILGLHRIPHAPADEEDTNRPSVLVMHGLASSSADFVAMGPGNSLAYLLADQGYDVWLGNARGNTWSRNHTSLQPTSRDFWQFSWNEIGTIDLPAMIDYILETTDNEKIYYIGHGQGTTTFLVMASEIPEYNDKIRTMASLSPVAYMTDFVSPAFRIIAPYYGELEWLLNLLGIYEIGPHSDLISQIANIYCDDGHPYQDICADIMFIFNGYSYSQINATMLPVILSSTPDGAAAKQYYHYAQVIQSGSFRKYDYGTTSNLNIYGQTLPPEYDLSQITAPVALFYSSNDWLCSVSSAQQLASILPNVALFHEVELDTFNHVDFLYGIDVKTLVYDIIFELFKKY